MNSNSIFLHFVNPGHFFLENDCCDINVVQHSTFEDLMSCSGSNKSTEFHTVLSILSDRLSNVTENNPTCITYTPAQEYNFKYQKAKQALNDTSMCNPSNRDNNDIYYGIQHGLKKILVLMLKYQPSICGVRMMQNLNQPKHGLMWAHSHLMPVLMDIW